MRASRLLRATGGKNSALASASCAARNAPFFAALTKKTVASVGGFFFSRLPASSRAGRVVSPRTPPPGKPRGLREEEREPLPPDRARRPETRRATLQRPKHELVHRAAHREAREYADDAARRRRRRVRAYSFGAAFFFRGFFAAALFLFRPRESERRVVEEGFSFEKNLPSVMGAYTVSRNDAPATRFQRAPRSRRRTWRGRAGRSAWRAAPRTRRLRARRRGRRARRETRRARRRTSRSDRGQRFRRRAVRVERGQRHAHARGQTRELARETDARVARGVRVGVSLSF